MQLVEIFLPLNDNEGRPLPRDAYAQVREELIGRFQGLTAYNRAPVTGLWKSGPNETPAKDEIVIYEVLDPALDPTWWREFRKKLEGLFRQESILIRASDVRIL